MTTRRDFIEAKVRDLAGAFLYYDRKGDEDLPVGEIEAAVRAGEISKEEILRIFSEALGLGAPTRFAVGDAVRPEPRRVHRLESGAPAAPWITDEREAEAWAADASTSYLVAMVASGASAHMRPPGQGLPRATFVHVMAAAVELDRRVPMP